MPPAALRSSNAQGRLAESGAAGAEGAVDRDQVVLPELEGDLDDLRLAGAVAVRPRQAVDCRGRAGRAHPERQVVVALLRIGREAVGAADGRREAQVALRPGMRERQAGGLRELVPGPGEVDGDYGGQGGERGEPDGIRAGSLALRRRGLELEGEPGRGVIPNGAPRRHAHRRVLRVVVEAQEPEVADGDPQVLRVRPQERLRDAHLDGRTAVLAVRAQAGGGIPQPIGTAVGLPAVEEAALAVAALDPRALTIQADRHGEVGGRGDLPRQPRRVEEEAQHGEGRLYRGEAREVDPDVESIRRVEEVEAARPRHHGVRVVEEERRGHRVLLALHEAVEPGRAGLGHAHPRAQEPGAVERRLAVGFPGAAVQDLTRAPVREHRPEPRPRADLAVESGAELLAGEGAVPEAQIIEAGRARVARHAGSTADPDGEVVAAHPQAGRPRVGRVELAVEIEAHLRSGGGVAEGSGVVEDRGDVGPAAGPDGRQGREGGAGGPLAEAEHQMAGAREARS